jgi:hypothetical protein
VGAGVHQDDAVAGAEEKFGLGYNAYAVVGYAVEEEYPAAVGVVGADDPASQKDAVGGADIEVFAVTAAVGEGGVGFADEVGGEFAADGMEEVGGDEPASNACQDGRQEEKDQEDAD